MLIMRLMISAWSQTVSKALLKCMEIVLFFSLINCFMGGLNMLKNWWNFAKNSNLVEM